MNTLKMRISWLPENAMIKLYLWIIDNIMPGGVQGICTTKQINMTMPLDVLLKQ